MTFEERLRQVLEDDVPAPREPVEGEPEALPDEPPPEATPVVRISAVGSGRSVTVDEFALKLAAVQAQVEGPDLDHAAFGRLLRHAKDNGPAHLLKALLAVRTTSFPLYKLRREDGRPWTTNPITQETASAV